MGIVLAGVPGWGGVAGVNNVDAVGDPPGAPQVLAFHPGGVLTGLLLPRLVDHQHRISGVAQVPHREGAHRVHRLTGVPGRALQQPLHPVRRGVPGLLGQRPAILAREVTEQPGDVLAGLPPRLDPRETARQPAHHQLIQLLTGRRGFLYRGGGSRLKIGSCHKLMITRRLPPTPRSPRMSQVIPASPRSRSTAALLEEYRDSLKDPSPDLDKHIEYLDALVNQDIWEEFQDISIEGNFAGIDTRKMAEQIGLISEYRLLFAPASASVHGEWGALDQYVLTVCENPLHRHHRIPRADLHIRLGPELVDSAIAIASQLVGDYVQAFTDDGRVGLESS